MNVVRGRVRLRTYDLTICLAQATRTIEDGLSLPGCQS